MMSIDEIEAYRKELEWEMRTHNGARMRALNEKRYRDMEDHSHAFDRAVARIDTIDKILSD